jgi:hypothetical protein
MSFTAFIWITTISVPLWLILILLVKKGLVAFSTIILVNLTLVGALFLILRLSSARDITIEFPYYEFKHIGDDVWHIVSEKKAMERLVDGFDPVTPAISRILKGEEIIVSNEIYRLLRT